MGSFVHLPNGNIIINEEYNFSLELFKKLEPDYYLPKGLILRKYIQGNTHYCSTGFSESSLPLDWKEGDRYITRLSELLYLEQHEIIKEEERKEYFERIKNNIE
jgi:hypothetical protein